MPLSPGADLLDVPDRATEISVSVIGVRSRMGRGVGLSGWAGKTSGRSMMKNRFRKASHILWGSSKTWEGPVRRGGMRLMDRPFRQAAASQRCLEVV